MADAAQVELSPLGRRAATSLTSFVGREQTLARLHSELKAHRLVTLTGPGGVGKTRTALTAAQDADFVDGVHVVELAAITDASQIAPAVATALRVSDQSNRDAVDRVIDHLSGTTSLLVLDNCEHLITGSVRLVLRLLEALDDLRDRQRAQSHGSQLDGEGDPVELAAQGDDGLPVSFGDRELGQDAVRPVQEQPDRGDVAQG